MIAAPPIPVAVIGGYLGAGKTTLVNHLVRHAGGRRLAVLVNDFGEVGIDADLIEAQDGGVLSLAGGCVCCDIGADLVGALEAVRDRAPAPDLILIETSGVALPQSVARSARLATGLSDGGVFVLADAETVRTQAADRYVGDTVLAQLSGADVVVLNKTDLAGPSETRAVADWLAVVARWARVVAAAQAAAPVELLFGPDLARAERDEPHPPHAHFTTGVRRFDGPIDLAALAAGFTAEGSPVVRAKGFAVDLDGARKLLQVVGRRVEIAPAPASSDTSGAVVWIAAPTARGC